MEKLVSNKEIVDKTYELVKEIKNSKEFIEYNNLKEKVYQEKDIMYKINKIKTLQKEYVRSAFLDIKIEEEINILEAELKENDLYKDFINKEVELNKILFAIKEGLNITLNDLVEYK